MIGLVTMAILAVLSFFGGRAVRRDVMRRYRSARRGDRVALPAKPREWGLDPESLRTARIEDLAATIVNQRVRLSELTLPHDRRTIRGKTFQNCRIVGPSVIMFGELGLVQNNVFERCDFLFVRRGAILNTPITIEACVFEQCYLTDITVLVREGSAMRYGPPETSSCAP